MLKHQIVRAIVGSREAQLVKPYPKEELRLAFSFHPPGYLFMPLYKSGVWDGRVKKLSRDKVPTGLLLALKDTIERELNIAFQLDFRTTPIHFNNVNTDSRDYQTQCVEAMKRASQTGGGLIIAATGIGKTRIAGDYFKSLKGNGCFIVDELTLLHQSKEAIQAIVGEPIGIVGESLFEPQRITIATAQTMHLHQIDPKFMDWVDKQQVLIIDELHLQLSRRTFSFVENICPPVVFGLTATLQLGQKHINMQAYSLAGPVIFTFPLEQATSQGYLTRGIVVQLQLRTDIWRREFTEAYHALVDNKKRNALIVELALAAVKAGRRVVILVDWVKHLKFIFSSLGFKVESRLIYGAVKVQDRRQAITEFESGKVKLLVANRVFQKGIDIKSVDFIIDATAGKSPNGAIQRYGRGVRQAAGKHGLVYIDIGDDGQFEAATKRRHSAFRKERIQVYQVGYRPTLNVTKLVERAIELSEEHGNQKKTG